MDKRIIKTKKALKEALLELLSKQDFESIKTKEICEKALVSRNTFYNYYADKYALLEECFQDYEEQFQELFSLRQEKNNPEHDVKKGFLNLIDAFLDTVEKYSSIPILSNFDLTALYYRVINQILEKYEDEYAHFLNPSYDFKQLNAFLVLGFWGFVHGNPVMKKEDIRKETHKFALDLLESPIFQV